MVLSTYEKQRILHYCRNGLRPLELLSALRAEGIFTSGNNVLRFILRFQARKTSPCKQGSGRASVICDRVLELVDRALEADDETTATQLHVLLTSCELRVSLSPFFAVAGFSAGDSVGLSTVM